MRVVGSLLLVAVALLAVSSPCFADDGFDSASCCNGTMRFVDVRFGSASNEVFAMVENIDGCAENGTVVGSGWLKVDVTTRKYVAASQSEVASAREAAAEKGASVFQSEISPSVEDKQVTFTVYQDGTELWSYTYGCDASFSQAGPTWVSDENHKAYFIMPSCDGSPNARYTIVDLVNLPAEGTELSWHNFFEADNKLVNMRYGGLHNSPYYAQGYVFNDAEGDCVDHIVFSFSNTSVRVAADDYFPARTWSFVDPAQQRLVQMQLAFSELQLNILPAGQSAVQFSVASDTVATLLQDNAKSPSYYWAFALGGVLLLAIVVAVAIAGYVLYQRHRRREEAKVGQVDEFDPDLGYAEL